MMDYQKNSYSYMMKSMEMEPAFTFLILLYDKTNMTDAKAICIKCISTYRWER